MATPSEPRALVLVTLRLGSLLETTTVASRSGLDPAAVDALLADLEAQGLARHRDGRVSGWMLTAPGRDETQARVAAETDQPGVRSGVDAGYRRFLEVNQRLIDACTAWQLRTVDGAEVPNDHLDADHDGRVLAEFEAVDAVAQPVAVALAGCLDRLAGYGPRLAGALDRARAGETGWLTGPTIDSYHTVWFEWHENLLMTLGIERGQERSEASTPLQEAR